MTAQFTGFSAEEATAFADRWLPAWTGGDADRLARFYADEAFYRDPHATGGIHGRPALARYFRALLAANPAWVWTQTGATPLEGGFLNHWHAHIPTPAGPVDCRGVCTVVFGPGGRIARNEVFFDTTPLLAAARKDRR